MFFITTECTFDAAHYLPFYQGKCENLHGHTYRLQVTIQSSELKDGIAYDFSELKKVVKREIFDLWDHQLLNDHMENPSAENMCMFIWDKLSQAELLGSKLYEVKIWETPTSSATLKRG